MCVDFNLQIHFGVNGVLGVFLVGQFFQQSIATHPCRISRLVVNTERKKAAKAQRCLTTENRGYMLLTLSFSTRQRIFIYIQT